jgi:hypothetical protein
MQKQDGTSEIIKFAHVNRKERGIGSENYNLVHKITGILGHRFNLCVYTTHWQDHGLNSTEKNCFK